MYFFYPLLLVVLITVNVKQYAFTNLMIHVEEGQLEGIEEKTFFTGKTICAFLGIPYAEPPTGDLRFLVILSKCTF